MENMKTDVAKSFYCQTKRCDKTKNNQCDECALKELNDNQIKKTNLITANSTKINLTAICYIHC